MTDWMTNAPCRSAPDLFFSYSVDAQQSAADICRTECEHRDECRAWAIAHGDINDEGRAVHGVIAGVIPPAQPRNRDERNRPTLKRCELVSCGRLFMGDSRRRYCDEVCFSAARAATRRDERERPRLAS